MIYHHHLQSYRYDGHTTNMDMKQTKIIAAPCISGTVVSRGFFFYEISHPDTSYLAKAKENAEGLN